MKWQTKAAIRRTVLGLPSGARCYRWLTIQVMATQSGMAAKWFRVMPGHIRVLQECFGSESRNQSLWCYDSGATPAAGLAMALISDCPGLLTDRYNRLSDRYVDVSREVFESQGGNLAQMSEAPANRFGEISAKLAAARRSLAMLEANSMTYAADHAVGESGDWRGRIGCIFSAGTLEHYKPAQLDAEVKRMAAALKPGGVLSHVVDHRDHRWHADKSISPLLHLSLSREEYDRRFDNPLDYHNRWLQSRWVRLFEEHGFKVRCEEIIPYSDDLVPLPEDARAEEFAEASPEDLHCLVTRFVATKQPAA